MQISNLGYRTDLMVLRVGGSEVADKGGYVVVRTPANPAYWWGNFLLFRTPAKTGELGHRVELFRAEFPAANHVALGVDSVDGSIGAEDELTAAGLELERSTVLTARRLTAPWRTDEQAVCRRFVDADWDQLADLSLAANGRSIPGYGEFAEGKARVNRAMVGNGVAWWFGAFDGDRLVASLGLVCDDRGAGGVARYQSVQTHPDARRRGLASTLVHQAAEFARTELGGPELVIVADPEYHAIDIYQRLGFAGTQTQIQLIRRPQD